ncbi:MAG TPA: hypothetical protein VMB48_12590 [Steroidobacteraceae bacterium]|nr:hypothetical protein [Steroidobacteraceae bacterium]
MDLLTLLARRLFGEVRDISLGYTSQEMLDRRTIMMLGAGAALATAAGAVQAGPEADAARWQPAAEPLDAWLDRPGSRHRLAFDTTTAAGLQAAVRYADNYFIANKSAYGLGADELAVVIIVRHLSTPFGYNDAMWARYGKILVDLLNLAGRQAVDAAHANPLGAAAAGSPGQTTLATLAAKGTRFAVCGMATQEMAGMIAKAAKQDADAVKKELTSNLVDGAVLVPAGIVSVNRVQEHGYALASAG